MNVVWKIGTARERKEWVERKVEELYTEAQQPNLNEE